MQILKIFIRIIVCAGIFCAARPHTLLALGQAPPESAERWRQEDEAAKALETLRRTYTDRDFSGFFDAVSEDYRQGWIDLRSDLAEERRSTSSVDLRFSAGQTTVEGDKAALQVRWQKRAMAARTGQSQLSEGSAEFIFQKDSEGSYKLIDIRGQSPFR